MQTVEGGAVFLDRDGVICENRSDYVKSWDEFVFLPNALDAVTALHQAGLRIIIVTNQSPIERGIFNIQRLDDIHRRMVDTIEAHGGQIEKILYCPHHPKTCCNCRKPKPGMLLQAAETLNINLAQSFMVGDAATDIMAGQAVDCQSLLVLTGRGQQQLPIALKQASSDFRVVAGLPEAVKHILYWSQANSLKILDSKQASSSEALD